MNKDFEAVVRVGEFEMPKDRLLTYEEAKVLKRCHYHPIWIKCKQCRVLGATTDPDQEFCSEACHETWKLFDKRVIQAAMDLVSQNGYAQPGDTVHYEGKAMFVYASNCTNERLRKPYLKTFTYVLISDCEKVVVKDLKEPLRKMLSDL